MNGPSDLLVALSITELIPSCVPDKLCACRTLVYSHILCCGVVPQRTVSLFAVVVGVGGFGLLGELWSSILSGCLMEQAAPVDNVKGCEGGRWWFLCQTGGTGMKLRDYSSDIL